MKITLITGALFLICLYASATTVRNKNHGYSITLPDQWKQIPPKIVAEVMENVSEKDSAFDAKRVEFAFQTKKQKNWFSYPHILVEYLELENPQQLSLDQYRKIYTREIEEKGKGLAGSFMPFVKVDSIDFSQKSNIIRIKSVMTIEDAPILYMYAGFIPTSDGIMKIYCYSRNDDYYGDQEKDFTEIISSVNFSDDVSESSEFFESINGVKILMIIVGAVFFWFFVVALKKNLA
jgi:hypothetical protein